MPASQVPIEPPDTDPAATSEAISAQPGGVNAHPSGLAIIASKISPATPGRSVLSRPRLIEWFSQQAGARLLLISAEAGYGKSTLLNDFALNTRDHCVWYRMESSDGDWITFLSHMVAAFREISPGFGRSTEALLRNVAAMGPSSDVVLSQFLADLGSVDLGRVAVILDDYHYVEGSSDVRMILSRLLERAPEPMYFILGGRGRPRLALGRLLAQGRVAELTIDDLRFTLEEIEELFSSAYGQPLDEAACRIVAERTEGWAASLQLVSASIAASRPSEVADFIDALSGASGPTYDFLAEEVLTRLSPRTERVLMHASLIDRVRVELVTAALATTSEPWDARIVREALDDAERLGLLGDRSKASSGRRIHPLFREFLRAHLEREMSRPQIRAMHHAIATEAELTDWLVSARHFALADDPVEGMRVLGSAASEALGTGAWGAAVEILDLMPLSSPPIAVKVIQARALISDGFSEDALGLLRDTDRAGLSPEERGLVGLTLAAIHHMHGRGDQVRVEVERVAGDDSIPKSLHEIALSWRQLLLASAGGCITDAVQMLRRLAIDQRRAGLHYFAGVTLHNTAYADLARGNYESARQLALEAMTHLDETDDAASISASTQSISAAATAELGDLEEGLRLANAIASSPSATADAIADAVYLNAVCGRIDKGRYLLARFDRGDAPWSLELGSRAQGLFARIALSLGRGELEEAQSSLRSLKPITSAGIDTESREAVVSATLALLQQSPDAPQRVETALETTSRQNAWRWAARARILEAVAKREGAALSMWIEECERDSYLAVLELADVIATAVGTLAPVPQALERSILREPTRWVSALSRQVRQDRSENASAAAALVARFGTAEEASVLRRFDRARNGKFKRRGLATKLIRRVSPTVRVHDLGLTRLHIGKRLVTLTETRRKPGALLLYLVTRPNHAANREQVMEALWPDQNPKSATNSLHQTLFFLRREIEPWYEDGSTADYVRMDSDLVYLDRDLFQIDSVAFTRQATDILARGPASARGPELLRLYTGEFAPEFEYDEWAEAWRAHVHGVYLHLAHATAEALKRERRYSDVVEALSPVASQDPTAYDLRGTLIACLARLGAHDAALAHYRSMAVLHERDLGVPAPNLEDLIQELDQMD